MNVITLSQKKFESLEPLKLSRNTHNTEGQLYEFNYRGNNKVIKKLFHQKGIIFANKLLTLELLDTYSEYLPSAFKQPDFLISVEGKIMGFTTPRLYGSNLSDILHDSHISPKEHIYYLKKIGELLQQMKTIRKYSPLKDLYLNDLHESNFIIHPNNKELSVIDLDSCKIGSNIAFQSRFLTDKSLLNNVPYKYQINYDISIPGYVTADQNSDLYCYNMIILNYLYGANVDHLDLASFYQYLNYLKSIGINNELLDSFNRLVINADNKNPVNYLDSLTAEQVYRSKQTVYQKVKK